MTKYSFQDMIKKDKKEILIKKESIINPKKNIIEEDELLNFNLEKKSIQNTHYGLWFIAIITLIFLFFSFLSLFSKAYIVVNPKMRDVILNEAVSATKDLSENEEGLPYQLVIIDGEEVKNIEKISEANVIEKAKGNIVLYNAFSINPQILEKNTKVVGSNGKIYKIENKVIIPGQSEEGIPGSVEVSIYANEDGESYNSTPIDFNIYSYKNTPKYEKIYGRSKGDISGGFNGKMKLVDEEQKEKIIKELENSLETNLLKKAIDQIPPGFVLFKNAVSIKYINEIDNTSLDKEDVSIKVKGILYGFLFDEKKFVNEIIRIKYPSEENQENELYIPNIKDLDFILTDKNVFFDQVKKINFRIANPIKIVSYVDKDTLINDLIGKEKKDFKNILYQYKNIESADLKIKPIWENEIPSKPKKIEIMINYPE